MKCSVLVLLASFFVSGYAVACRQDVEILAPDGRYEIVDNGYKVKDNKTGLIWQRCYIGQSWDGAVCKGVPALYSWEGALRYTKGAKVEVGWRVPNIKELESLIETACHNPAVNNTFITTTNWWYVTWSSTPSAFDSSGAWAVNFDKGYINSLNKGYGGYVRLVRSSQ